MRSNPLVQFILDKRCCYLNFFLSLSNEILLKLSNEETGPQTYPIIFHHPSIHPFSQSETTNDYHFSAQNRHPPLFMGGEIPECKQ